MKRDPASHKGENGRIAIIGGSRHMHGAPLFSALSAEASGVDLIQLMLPRCHEEVAKQASYNFMVYPFIGDDLSSADVEPLLELLASIDAAVIGPGLARDALHIKVMAELIYSASCPLVLDASALQKETLQWVAGKRAVLTPHLGELERMGIQKQDLAAKAVEYGITVLLKGPTDTIYCPDGTVEEVTGGTAGLTVGGTGDALAGVICGLLAQGYHQKDACIYASKTVKAIAEELHANGAEVFTTRELIQRISINMPPIVGGSARHGG